MIVHFHHQGLEEDRKVTVNEHGIARDVRRFLCCVAGPAVFPTGLQAMRVLLSWFVVVALFRRRPRRPAHAFSWSDASTKRGRVKIERATGRRGPTDYSHRSAQGRRLRGWRGDRRHHLLLPGSGLLILPGDSAYSNCGLRHAAQRDALTP